MARHLYISTSMKQAIIKVCERIMAYLDPVRLSHINISTEEIKFSLKGHIIPGVWADIQYTFGVCMVLDRPEPEGSEYKRKPGEHDVWFSDVTLMLDGVKKGSRLDRVHRADLAEGKLVSLSMANQASMSYDPKSTTEKGA